VTAPNDGLDTVEHCSAALEVEPGVGMLRCRRRIGEMKDARLKAESASDTSLKRLHLLRRCLRLGVRDEGAVRPGAGDAHRRRRERGRDEGIPAGLCSASPRHPRVELRVNPGGLSERGDGLERGIGQLDDALAKAIRLHDREDRSCRDVPDAAGGLRRSLQHPDLM
jgi:hypothetical protein